MIVWKEFTFDSAHRLLDYKGACGKIHGHTWKVQLGFTGELQSIGNERDMVMDFNTIKHNIKTVMEKYDHAIILEETDPFVEFMKNEKQKLVVLPMRPTVENMAVDIKELAACDYIKIWETLTSYAEI